MKKIILPLLLAIIATSTFAQNNLTVFSETGDAFYLILNGVRQNENPETNVRVNGLTSDYYTAKVIFNNGSLGEIDKKTLMVTGVDCRPCDVTYKIKRDKKGSLVMKPFAFSTLATAPPPPPNVRVVQYNTVPMPAPVIGVQVTETTTTTVNGNTETVNMGVNVNINDGFGTSTHTTTHTQTTVTNMSGGQAVVVEGGCYAMGEGAFSSLMSSVQSKSWDEERLTIAKQATSANCLTANQVKRLMNVFEWEDAKLDFAKYAYAYCYDQQNYYQVNDAFEWDDSIQELNSYIGR